MKAVHVAVYLFAFASQKPRLILNWSNDSDFMGKHHNSSYSVLKCIMYFYISHAEALKPKNKNKTGFK